MPISTVEVVYTGDASSAVAAAREAQAAQQGVIDSAGGLSAIDDGYAAAAGAAQEYAGAAAELLGAVQALSGVVGELAGVLGETAGGYQAATTGAEGYAAATTQANSALSEQLATLANNNNAIIAQADAGAAAEEAQANYAAGILQTNDTVLAQIAAGEANAAAMEANAQAASAMGQAQAAATDGIAASADALAIETDIAATWRDVAGSLVDIQASLAGSSAAVATALSAQTEAELAASAGAADLKVANDGLKTSEEAAGESSSLLSGRLVLLLAGYAAFKAIGVPIDFQAGMEKVQGMAGVAADEMGVLKDNVLQLSVATGSGPTELANELYYIKSAGFDAAQSVLILKQATEDARASQSAATPIADALTSTLRAYGQTASSVASDSDILMQTVVEGKMQFSDLAGTLGRILPIAGELGVPLDQIGASIAEMTQKGLSAEEATTALRGALLALEAPSKQTTAALAAIGLTADDVRQSITDKGFLQTIRDLVSLTGGNLDELHGLIPNIRALVGVLADVGKSGSDYANVLASIDNASGRSAEAFKTYEGTAKASLDHLKADVQVGLIDVGTAAGTALGPAVKGIEGFASGIDGMLNKSPELRAMSGVIIDIAGAAVGLTIAGQAFGMMAGALGSGAIFQGVGMLASATTSYEAMTVAVEGFGAASAAAAVEEGALVAVTTALDLAFSPLAIGLGLAALAYEAYSLSTKQAVSDTQAFKDGAQQVKQIVADTQNLPRTAIPGKDSQQTVLDTILSDAKTTVKETQAEIDRVTIQQQQIKDLGNYAGKPVGQTDKEMWAQYDKDTKYLKSLNDELGHYSGNVDQAQKSEADLNAAINKDFFKGQAADLADAKDQALNYARDMNSAATQEAAVGDSAALAADGIGLIARAFAAVQSPMNAALVDMNAALKNASASESGTAATIETWKVQYDVLGNLISQRQRYDTANKIAAEGDSYLNGLISKQNFLYNDHLQTQTQDLAIQEEANKNLQDLEIAYTNGSVSIDKLREAEQNLALASPGVAASFQTFIAAAQDMITKVDDAKQHVTDYFASIQGQNLYQTGGATGVTGLLTGGLSEAINAVTSGATGTFDSGLAQKLIAQGTDAGKQGNAAATTAMDAAITGSPDTSQWSSGLQNSASIGARNAWQAAQTIMSQTLTATATVQVNTTTTNTVNTVPAAYNYGASAVGPGGPPPSSGGGGGSVGVPGAGTIARFDALQQKATDNGELEAGYLAAAADLQGSPYKPPIPNVKPGAGFAYKPPAVPKVTPPKAAPGGKAAKGPAVSKGTAGRAAAGQSAAAAAAAAKKEAAADVAGLKTGLDDALASFDAIIHPNGKNALVAKLEADLTSPDNAAGISDAMGVLFNGTVKSGSDASQANADTIIQAWWTAATKGVTDPSQIAALTEKRDAMIAAMQATVPDLQSIATDSATIDANVAKLTDLFDPSSLSAKRNTLVQGMENNVDPSLLIDSMFGTHGGNLTATQAAQIPKIIQQAEKAILDDPNLNEAQKTAAIASLSAFSDVAATIVSPVGNVAKANTEANAAVSSARGVLTDAKSNKGGANALMLGDQVGAAYLSGDYTRAQQLLMSDPLNLPDIAAEAIRYINQKGQDANAVFAALGAATADIGSASNASKGDVAALDTTAGAEFTMGFNYGKSSGKANPNYDNVARQAANFVEAGDLRSAAKLIASTGDDADKVGQMVIADVQSDASRGMAAAKAADNDANWANLGNAAGIKEYKPPKSTGSQDAQAFTDQQTSELNLINDRNTQSGNMNDLAAFQKALSTATTPEEIAQLGSLIKELQGAVTDGTATIHADEADLRDKSAKANALAEANIGKERQQQEAWLKAINAGTPGLNGQPTQAEAQRVASEQQQRDANTAQLQAAILWNGLVDAQRQEQMAGIMQAVAANTASAAASLQSGQAIYMDSGALVGTVVRGASERVALESNLF